MTKTTLSSSCRLRHLHVAVVGRLKHPSGDGNKNPVAHTPRRARLMPRRRGNCPPRRDRHAPITSTKTTHTLRVRAVAQQPQSDCRLRAAGDSCHPACRLRAQSLSGPTLLPQSNKLPARVVYGRPRRGGRRVVFVLRYSRGAPSALSPGTMHHDGGRASATAGGNSGPTEASSRRPTHGATPAH